MPVVGRVVIQGAGIGGLVLATALSRRGIEVEVIESVGARAVLGVGLSQPNNVLTALGTIGLRERCLEVGFPFDRIRVWDARGRETACLPSTVGRYGSPPNNGISRPLYAELLKAAAVEAGARVRDGLTIVAVDEDDEGATVELGAFVGRDSPPIGGYDIPSIRCDLVVGFDGTRSPLRRRLFGEAYTPRFTGSACWRAPLPRPAEIDSMVLAVDGDTRAIITPISSDRMYLAAVTPEPGNPRQDPDRLPAILKSRLQGFSGIVGDLRDAVPDDGFVSYVPLEYLTVREPWYRGRIAIAGDAAHTSTPHLAQGAAMAVEDAVVLAEELDRSSSLDAALSSWYARRRDRAQFVADMSVVALKAETGEALTDEESAMAELGLPGALARIAQSAY